MSIEDLEKIDIISTNETSGRVSLTISDHLPWDSDNEHLLILQDKINAYLNCIESGEIFDVYPSSVNKEFEITIYCKYKPNNEAEVFLKKILTLLKEENIFFSCEFEGEGIDVKVI